MLRCVRAQQVRRAAGLIALLVVAGCSAEEGAGSRTPAAPVSVVSSVAEGADLAGPVTWDATVTLHGVVQVRRVEFLIDDKVRWTQKTEPWRFSTDGRLDPWVLGPGDHELVVRVVTNPGPPTDTVSHVTVPPTPTGSVVLAGTYAREVTAGDIRAVSDYRLPELGAIGGSSNLGRWTMTVTPEGRLTLSDPKGFVFAETYTATPGRMRVYGVAPWLVETRPPVEFCHPEKAAGYTWELRGKELVVLAVDRTCADRDQALLGTWTRTG
jgi:hypothetical protein